MKTKSANYLASMGLWLVCALAGTKIMFSFGRKSNSNLSEAHPAMQKLANRALAISSVDFSIVDALRSSAETAANVQSGASRAKRSTHEDGLAIDVKAIGSQDVGAYYAIARAFRDAARELGIRVRWGGAWVELTPTLDPQAAVIEYKRQSKAKGETPLLDFGHFELYPKAMLDGKWVYTGKR